MSLTLEDLKNVRFPIAKKNGEGYRAIEVDAFLDQVEATLNSLIDENTRLKAQLDSLGNAPAPEAGGDGQAEAALRGQVEQLTGENKQLQDKVAELQRANDSQAAASGDAGAELDRLRKENESLRAEAQQAQEAVKSATAAAEAARARVEASTPEGGAPQRLVVTSAAQASPAVTRLVQLATEQAEAVVADATAEAQRSLDEAKTRAHQITLDAQTRAERIESEARVNAEQVIGEAANHANQVRSEAEDAAAKLRQDAQANADRVNYDADNHRRELFTQLEAERDQLVGKVEQLRGFEANYRTNFVQHLEQGLEAVKSANLQPGELPELFRNRTAPQSNTPRLDALLAEGN